MVDAVREMLRFEAERGAVAVFLAVFADTLFHMVGRKELHAGLVGRHVHDDAAFERLRFDRRNASVQAEIHVVAAEGLHARLIAVRVLADSLEAAEVHRRTRNRRKLARRQTARVVRRIAVGMNFQKLLLHRALAVEVKIAVVGQVQNRILIAPRRIVEHQPVSLPAELHRYRQRLQSYQHFLG